MTTKPSTTLMSVDASSYENPTRYIARDQSSCGTFLLLTV